jgi:hypothetical protein
MSRNRKFSDYYNQSVKIMIIFQSLKKTHKTGWKKSVFVNLMKLIPHKFSDIYNLSETIADQE